MSEEVLLGGQAVIEGVMMRAPGAYAVAVRRKGGDVVTQRKAVTRYTDRHPFLRAPVLRGCVALFQSLALGIRALNFSAEQALDADQEEGSDSKSSGGWAVAGSLFFALLFALGLFFYLPLFLTDVLARSLPVLGHGFAYSLVDGGIRILLFILYILGISLSGEMRRVFRYHGAEHKVVHAYEAGEELTVANARRHSTLHPRCGTSFLLFVMILSALAFAMIPTSTPFVGKLVARLVLLPLIAGCSFELLRASARRAGTPLFSLVVAPGLWLQRLTTLEPADEHLSVAIEALRAAMGGDVPVRREALPL
ncbi:MAG TPA: DUF1385 domain-containing protein [Candidatus Polarisedimenticolia bacterium]|nr:DUF1385 domain-containing protein [Candidatus Polarisedimenticolia bacterium]